MADTSKNGGSGGDSQELLGGDEEEERSVASVEDQLRKEMTVYEVCEIIIHCYVWLWCHIFFFVRFWNLHMDSETYFLLSYILLAK